MAAVWPAGSSVTRTMNARMFSSMSRPAAASATSATFSATTSRVIDEMASGPTTPAFMFPLMPTMSACWAAMREDPGPAAADQQRRDAGAAPGVGWPS